jgi:flagellar biogenesis protein FliO
LGALPTHLIAQTSRSTAAAIAQTDQAVENESLKAGETDATKPAALRATTTGSSNASDLMHIVFALAIVISLILLLRTGVRRMTSLPGSRAGKLVTVLSRSMISPRQQILVLQVGNRLLVVGDSGGAMSPLCEMTDPDEIASLIGQTRQSTDASPERKTSFGNIFRRAAEPFSDIENDPDSSPADDAVKSQNPPEAVSAEEVGGLMEKIRLLQQQYKLKA